MREIATLRGGCLCGSVSVEITGPIERQPETCHCTMCRKHRSSDKAERGFCSECGSTLFWKPTIRGYPFTAVAMGLFDAPTGLQLSKHTFAGEKGDDYEITDGVPQSDSD